MILPVWVSMGQWFFQQTHTHTIWSERWATHLQTSHTGWFTMTPYVKQETSVNWLLMQTVNKNQYKPMQESGSNTCNMASQYFTNSPFLVGDIFLYASFLVRGNSLHKFVTSPLQIFTLSDSVDLIFWKAHGYQHFHLEPGFSCVASF